jgi:hypothetical protein
MSIRTPYLDEEKSGALNGALVLAKFYSIKRAGTRRLHVETGTWRRIFIAVEIAVERFAGPEGDIR